MTILMIRKVSLLIETLPTLCACKGKLPSVNSLVCKEVSFFTVTFPALCTGVRLLPDFDFDVGIRAFLLRETVFLLRGLVGGMNFLLFNNIQRLYEQFLTLGA